MFIPHALRTAGENRSPTVMRSSRFQPSFCRWGAKKTVEVQLKHLLRDKSLWWDFQAGLERYHRPGRRWCCCQNHHRAVRGGERVHIPFDKIQCVTLIMFFIKSKTHLCCLVGGIVYMTPIIRPACKKCFNLLPINTSTRSTTVVVCFSYP